MLKLRRRRGYNIKIINNSNNMTNLETKVANIKFEKEIKANGLSFATKTAEDILKEKYGEIWDSMDSDLLTQMFRELLREENSVFAYVSKGKAIQIPNWFERAHYSSYKDEEDNQIINCTIVFNEDWRSAERAELSEIYLVTDIDGYIDYQLSLRETEANDRISDLEKRIEQEKANLEETKTYYVDAKRFSLSNVDYYKIDKLRKAESIKNGEISVEELANLV